MRDDAGDTADLPASSDTVVAGRYRLGQPLGQGAMANVYRAVDQRLGRHVALKLFHPGQEAAVRSRFGAEARALARLSHPALVAIFDAGVDGGRPFLVMQLVDGESLRDRLLGGPLSPGDATVLGARLADALAEVHRNDVVHRDIKPSNIVLNSVGVPHLADFGIALLLDAARMTGSNEILGTAAYLAPEQILGEPVGAPADVYSLGLVLLECVTGELEYPGVSKVESALARLHRPPRMPDTLPPGLAELLTAMTARHAADRPTAGQCATRLWGLRVSGGAATATPVRLWRSTRRSMTGLWAGWRRFAVAGSGLAMITVMATWLFTGILPAYEPGSGAGVAEAPGVAAGDGPGASAPAGANPTNAVPYPAVQTTIVPPAGGRQGIGPTTPRGATTPPARPAATTTADPGLRIPFVADPVHTTSKPTTPTTDPGDADQPSTTTDPPSPSHTRKQHPPGGHLGQNGPRAFGAAQPT